ncbi:MAG TPA: hypothetical protein VFK44_05925 [Bacillales bacterium]|nr:hypothetical protein [Bacillales bacterium]
MEKVHATISWLDSEREARVNPLKKRTSRQTTEEQLTTMDGIEFLSVAGGGVIIGLGIYLLSYII